MNELLKRVERIASDNQSGAKMLALDACALFEEIGPQLCKHEKGDFLKTFDLLAERLVAAKPRMAPILCLVHRMRQRLFLEYENHASQEQMIQAVAQEARDFKKGLLDADVSIAGKLLSLIQEGVTLITHSFSSTVKSVLLDLHKQGRNFTLIATESRPMLEGKKLAQELGDAGIRCTLIADAALLFFLDRADLALSGADAITEHFFVNKVGTRALALGAKERSMPFFVLSDTSKLIAESLLGKEDPLHPQNEILEEDLPNVEALNPYFENIPNALATGFVTEKGIVLPRDLKKEIHSPLSS